MPTLGKVLRGETPCEARPYRSRNRTVYISTWGTSAKYPDPNLHGTLNWNPSLDPRIQTAQSGVGFRSRIRPVTSNPGPGLSVFRDWLGHNTKFSLSSQLLCSIGYALCKWLVWMCHAPWRQGLVPWSWRHPWRPPTGSCDPMRSWFLQVASSLSPWNSPSHYRYSTCVSMVTIWGGV